VVWVKRPRVLCVALGVVCLMGLPVGAVSAAPPRCPAAYELSDLAEMERFVLDAGGQIGPELTGFFLHIDENGNGSISFKTLPEATPLPTPPLLAHDDRPASG